MTGIRERIRGDKKDKIRMRIATKCMHRDHISMKKKSTI